MESINNKISLELNKSKEIILIKCEGIFTDTTCLVWGLLHVPVFSKTTDIYNKITKNLLDKDKANIVL